VLEVKSVPHRAALAVAMHYPGTLAERREVLDMLGLIPSTPPTRDRVKPHCYGPRARPINHGTYGGWTTHKKRGQDPCKDCHRAFLEYQEAYRRKKGIQPRVKKPIEHGTANGYVMHRQRGLKPCKKCKAAAAAYRAELRRKHREAA